MCEHSSQELNGAIGEQNGNSIDNRITLAAALAPHGRFFKLQRLVADGADDQAQILRRQRLRAHGSILEDSANLANRFGRESAVPWRR